MKQVFHDKIVNIAGSDVFDRKFLLRKIIHPLIPSFNSKGRDVETIHLSDLLEQRKNTDLLLKVKEKPAMYSNVYSPKDELEIFEEIFEDALKNQKRVHIVGITLKEEVMILEKYYEELGFFREDINVFQVDFSAPLVSVSVKIENLMWKGSDYKRMGEQIFFNPPIRESGQVKAMFSGINRGVIAGIYLSSALSPLLSKEGDGGWYEFLGDCIRQENILPITLAKVLKYNYEAIGISGEEEELIIAY